jgi:ABC-type nitrate/sulfonate/bicarbonate transport system substrate-binding protein
MCARWVERRKWRLLSNTGKSPAQIQYSNVVIAVSRDFYRRSPEIVEAIVRAYTEGVAATHFQKERALKVIGKYTRLKDSKLIAELYDDAVKFGECRG